MRRRCNTGPIQFRVEDPLAKTATLPTVEFHPVVPHPGSSDDARVSGDLRKLGAQPRVGCAPSSSSGERPRARDRSAAGSGAVPR